jgi:hypothetical protein
MRRWASFGHWVSQSRPCPSWCPSMCPSINCFVFMAVSQCPSIYICVRVRAMKCMHADNGAI